MGAPRISPTKKKHYLTLRLQGFNMKAAAEEAKVSYAWARANDRGLKSSAGRDWAAAKAEEQLQAPVPLDQLCPEARGALDDIKLFARRYFGALVVPWQEEATAHIVEWQQTPEEEFVVINSPPGSGKSTFFTLILPAWITCRQRHIRGLIGSGSMSMAKQYVNDLRQALETPLPIRQSPEAIAHGYAVDAEAALCVDFGTFRPEGLKWASDAFHVSQHDDAVYRAKEPTWQAFGRGTFFIGSRVDFCIWDDVYDPDQMRTVEARDELKRWWKNVAEKRVEPGGLLILQGQRLDPDDIYRYALDQVVEDYDEEGEETGESRRMYHHLKFQAHYEDRCTPDHHKRSAPPYPEGCLLFPKRITWKKIAGEMKNNPLFPTLYQQEDVNPRNVLVPDIWITGGDGPNGEIYIGCLDHDRGLCEIPRGMVGPWLSVATADPSPAKFWSIQWWLVHIESGQRFLMDLIRQAMGANEFIDRVNGRFTGIMEEWQQRSIDLGVPITHWVVEQNNAERFIFQFQHSKDWMSARNVDVRKHETHRNKANQDYGVQTIGSVYRYGKVRLPYKPGDAGRMATLKLRNEVTTYPMGRTDDCVMAHWFLEWNLPYIELPHEGADMQVPSWLLSETPAVKHR